ncbi:uncharacterized protein KZ484_026224 [Pholidichthys leucotaenia]
MNLVKNKTLLPHLRDEEAQVVENAIRLAIDSIMNVLYGVNSARTREYQRMVADRDKEIQRLEGRLTETEQVLRQRGCTCGMFGSSSGFGGARSSSGRPRGEQSGFEPGCTEDDTAADEQECEMSISLGVFARPPSHISSISHESALPSSPGRMLPDQTCTSHSSEGSGVTEPGRNPPTSPGSLAVKEEPCEMDTIMIKWEMSDETFSEHQDSTGENLESGVKTKFVEKPQSDHAGYRVVDGEHQRTKKKNVPMSELSEEAQRLKRAAWRAASRRYYARKIARQQVDLSCSAMLSSSFPHITNSPSPLPRNSFTDSRRRSLISQLPAEAQTLQREAWRAASRRYYARKIARHQTETEVQYGHLLEDLSPPMDPQGATGAGDRVIMCS